jgi:hypothetical protein
MVDSEKLEPEEIREFGAKFTVIAGAVAPNPVAGTVLVSEN